MNTYSLINTSKAQAIKLIEDKQNLGNWTFAYIGPDPSGWGQELVSHAKNTMAYNASKPDESYSRLGYSVRQFRANTLLSTVNLLEEE